VAGVTWFTANLRSGACRNAHAGIKGSPTPYVTEAELVEIVRDLRALTGVEASAEMRVALNRLANRYIAMADHPTSALNA
jgi:hypothetical protein